MDSTVLQQIITKLNTCLGIKTKASSRGRLIIPLSKEELNPFIIFEHGGESLKKFCKILLNMGMDPKLVDKFIRSKIILENGEVTIWWIFRLPSNYYSIRTEEDIDQFWEKFLTALNKII